MRLMIFVLEQKGLKGSKEEDYRFTKQVVSVDRLLTNILSKSDTTHK